jgi:D-inositol-3-phosphate glycosyltransferase
MRRIAMISEHASPVANMGSTDSGGQNVYVDQVSRGLAALGYAVDVYTRADAPDLAPVAWVPGVRILPVPAGPLAPIPKDAIWPQLPQFLAEMERLGAQYGPYDLIHGNFWMSGWVGAHLRERWGIPFVEIFHALGLVKRQHQGEADTSPPERIAVERLVLEAADRVIAQCPSEVDELASRYGANPLRIRVVPSGVDLARFSPIPRDEARRALGLAPAEAIVAYVGRLLPRKDVANLIEALPLLVGDHDGQPPLPRPVRLLVVGGETPGPDLAQEPEMRRLIALAERLGVREQVTFVGRRPADRLRWYYSAADVFATTPWYEPYGLTPLEAMACGVPAVCAAVGGITYTVADGATGLLVPPRQPAPLAAALRRILADDGWRAQLARQSRARVEAQFTWPVVARQTARVYEEVLERWEVSGGIRHAARP